MCVRVSVRGRKAKSCARACVCADRLRASELLVPAADRPCQEEATRAADPARTNPAPGTHTARNRPAPGTHTGTPYPPCPWDTHGTPHPTRAAGLPVARCPPPLGPRTRTGTRGPSRHGYSPALPSSSAVPVRCSRRGASSYRTRLRCAAAAAAAGCPWAPLPPMARTAAECVRAMLCGPHAWTGCGLWRERLRSAAARRERGASLCKGVCLVVCLSVCWVSGCALPMLCFQALLRLEIGVEFFHKFLLKAMPRARAHARAHTHACAHTHTHAHTHAHTP
jgi:hypothetical protein